MSRLLVALATAALTVAAAGCSGDGAAGTSPHLQSASPRGSGIDGSVELRGRFGHVPFAGARVVVHPVGGETVSHVKAGLDGRFRVALPPGEYAVTAVYRRQPSPPGRVTVTKDRYAPVQLSLLVNGRSLDTPPLSAPTRRGVTSWLDGNAELVGRFGHKPFAGGHVHIRPLSSEGPVKTVRAALDGRFVLALPAGRYIVYAGFFGSRGGVRTVTLKADRVGHVTLSLLVNQKGGEFRDATAPLPHNEGAAKAEGVSR